MSTHEVPVIKIDKIECHPNADALDVIRIFGWTCCVKKGSLSQEDIVAYVPPDYVVDTRRQEFSFLSDGKSDSHRVRVKRLRGLYSQGLLVKAPSELKPGDNAAEILGVIRYEPPMNFESTAGEDEGAPSCVVSPKYDVENFYRYAHLFEQGEDVVATEKHHGSNARFVYSGKEDRIFCGSRTSWKRENKKNLWWRALEKNQWIREWCNNNRDSVLYGEVFGNVQDLRYGAKKDDVFFVAFDIFCDGRWLDFDEAHRSVTEDGDRKHAWAAVVYDDRFDVDKLVKLANGLDSRLPGADHLAEGIVIRPKRERRCDEIGRVQLKIVSDRYLERAR